jgi:hypothetical protein
LTGADAGDYTLTQPTGLAADITPAPLTVTGAVAGNKVYDTTLTDTLSNFGTLSGVLSGDTVTLDSMDTTAAFGTKNVGNNKAVTVAGYTLGGTDANNYALTQPTGLTADITPAALTITGAAAGNKVYDGTLADTLSNVGTLSGVLGSDAVTVTTSGYTADFATKDAGNNKAVAVTGYTIGGVDAGNYTLTQPTGLTADITPATLTVSAAGVDNKVYDTTTTATLNVSGLQGVVIGDTVTLAGGYTANFTTKDVGNDIPVTVSPLTLTGANAGDYTLTQPTGLAADITPAPLTITGAAASDKVYDTTLADTLSNFGALSGVLSGDTVTLDSVGSTATFATKNVGNNKPVTVAGYSLGGTDANNYALTQPTGLTANITPANLTVTGITANDKAYDGTTAATLDLNSADLHGVLANDNVGVSPTGYTANFANSSANTDVPVTVANLGLDGADGGNYTLTQPTGLTADITAAAPAPPTPPPIITITTITTDPVVTNLPAPANQVPVTSTPPTFPANNTASGNLVPVSYSDSQAFAQTVQQGGVLANSSGTSGDVGSGDVAQINNGGLNNVSSPAAAGALNQALGPEVRDALADALQADYGSLLGDTSGTTPGSDDQETILTGGDVVQIENNKVKSIPLSQAPQQLQDAMKNGMNGMPSGTGH